MVSPSSSVARRPGSAVGRAVGIVAAVAVPFVVALLLWVVAAPRSELISTGDGRGVRLPDSGAAGGTQLVMLILLLGFAVVCVAVALWHRHPDLRRPGGVLPLALIPGLACAVSAAAATPVGTLLAAPSREVPYGEVVLQAPSVGELFTGRMIYGSSGPSWDWLPPGAGWLLFGTMIAAFTVAALAHLSRNPDLRGPRPERDGVTPRPRADGGSRTGR